MWLTIPPPTLLSTDLPFTTKDPLELAYPNLIVKPSKTVELDTPAATTTWYVLPLSSKLLLSISPLKIVGLAVSKILWENEDSEPAKPPYNFTLFNKEKALSLPWFVPKFTPSCGLYIGL